MLCYCCAERGIERSAVALCRDCSAGLCLDHLRETASRFATGHMLETCHHDTWAVIKPQSAVAQNPAAHNGDGAPRDHAPTRLRRARAT